jgi:hypothetical protein
LYFTHHTKFLKQSVAKTNGHILDDEILSKKKRRIAYTT